MLYGIQLTALDLVCSLLAITAVVLFGTSVRFRWIRPGHLIAFLVVKLILGFSFTISAVLTGVESDACGYFIGGQSYAAMLRDLVRGDSVDYLRNTPFWWLDGRSTDRLVSLTGLFLVLTGGSFLGATAIACAFGATGQLLLYRFFRERFPEVRALYFLPVLFHPSLMLWSGMLLKDSFGIFAMGSAVYSLHRLLGLRQLSALVPLGLSIYVIFLFRSFIFLPLVAFVLFMIWDRVILPYSRRAGERGGIKALYLIAASMTCLLALWTLVNRFGGNLIEDRLEGAATFSRIEAGSSFQNAELSFGPSGILALGMGVINSLFRPFPWDVFKLIQAAAAVENILVIGFVWSGFHCFWKRISAQQRRQFSGIYWGMLVVALIIAAGVGLFASNSGTISRYRIPMIPFLVAVPGVALGMADSFARMGRRFNRDGLRPRFELPRKSLRST